MHQLDDVKVHSLCDLHLVSIDLLDTFHNFILNTGTV